MRYFFFILSVFISTLSIAQDLVEFQNGQVANAEDMNANFQRLKNEISLTGIRTKNGPDDLSTYGGAQSGLFGAGSRSTAYGVYALAFNATSSYDNTAIGHFSLAGITSTNMPGNHNTAIGSSTLAFNENGSHNTAVGYTALLGNIGGSSNTAIGVSALTNNNSGERNTAVGRWALMDNTTGENNTAMGAGALEQNVEGSENTAVGRWALLYNTTGVDNTAVGAAAMQGQEQSSGSSNTAIGRWSMFSNNSGSFNSAVGLGSLYSNIDGEANTAIGAYALYYNSTGYRNAAFGAAALQENTTGENNTALGPATLKSNIEGSNNTAAGRAALYENISGNNNSAMGRWALQNNTTGENNTAMGAYALERFQTGYNNTALGFGADIFEDGLSNAVAIGYQTIVDASNKVRIGNASVTAIEGQVPFTSSSDMRLKEMIKPVENGLAFINDLNPVSYTRISDNQKTIEMGLLAQEVMTALENYEMESSGMVHQANESSYLSLRYNDLFAPMIKAIQELAAHNKTLETRIDEQQQAIAQLVANKNVSVAALHHTPVPKRVMSSLQKQMNDERPAMAEFQDGNNRSSPPSAAAPSTSTTSKLLAP